jgi:hypothetical protein
LKNHATNAPATARVHIHKHIAQRGPLVLRSHKHGAWHHQVPCKMKQIQWKQHGIPGSLCLLKQSCTATHKSSADTMCSHSVTQVPHRKGHSKAIELCALSGKFACKDLPRLQGSRIRLPITFNSGSGCWTYWIAPKPCNSTKDTFFKLARIPRARPQVLQHSTMTDMRAQHLQRNARLLVKSAIECRTLR